MTSSWNDQRFMSESARARSMGVHPLAHTLLVVIGLFFLFAVIWAGRSELDEVTVGMGKVIPSGQVRLVQSLEGGMLASLEVKEGDLVHGGDILLHIDDTQFQASFQESQLKMLAISARVARLEVEAGERAELRFSPEILSQHPELVNNETRLLESNRRELNSNIATFTEQVEQKRHELVELRANARQIDKRLVLAHKELSLTQPMVEQGIMSKVELLRLQREVAELEGNLENATLTIPRLQSILKESENKAREPLIIQHARAQAGLSQDRAELQQLAQSLSALKDRVTRTEVRSPVHGTVIRVRVHTIGQVIRSGMDLVEIMPLEDSLLVEARIRPADIAFLRPGQDTVVKFTAYDFSIYGGLSGLLTQISADAITDEKGENFYKIQVRTHKNHLGTKDHPLPIIPGMVATTDIITGKKTVLDYLLKPILKTKANALRER